MRVGLPICPVGPPRRLPAHGAPLGPLVRATYFRQTETCLGDYEVGESTGVKPLEPSDVAERELREAVDRALNLPSISQALTDGKLSRDDVREEVLGAARDRWSAHASDEEQVLSADIAASDRYSVRQRYSAYVASGLGIATAVAGAVIAFVVGVSPHVSALVTALLALGLTVVTAAIVGSQALLVRRRQARAELARRAALSAQRSVRERLEVDVVLPEVRDVLNKRKGTDFGRTLDPPDSTGLGDLFDPEFDGPTRATQDLAKILRRLRAGSIGVSGPRGAGKSTLLRAAAEGEAWDAEANPLGVVVSAPVRYEAREFIPHLFGQLCLRVLEPTRDTERLRRTRAERRRAVSWLAATVYGLISATAGVAAAVSRHHPTYLVVLAVVGAAGAAVTVGLLPFVERFRAAGRSETTVTDQARDNLQQLRYLETRSSEWATEITAKAAKLSSKEGISLAAQPLTLPELTGRYTDFVRSITKERPLVVGIDELDKMASVDEAQRFLNDVKSLFGQPRTYYLISLSDDAMSAFERRGLPLRDVFESVFDDVLRVEPLNFDEAVQLLRRRVVGMAPPFVGLCYVLSGGLPRELIRTAREAVAVAQKPTGSAELGAVASQLVVSRASSRQRAAEVVAGHGVLPTGAQPVLEWLRGLEPQVSAEELLERTAVAPVILDLRATSAQPESDLELLIVELAAAWYHGGTVAEFFAKVDQQIYEDAVRSSGARGSALDVLSRASLDLGIAPHLAWTETSEFRQRVGLSPILEYPISIEAPRTAIE
jgi:type II secretory pathway pseudopilin PulG